MRAFECYEFLLAHVDRICLNADHFTKLPKCDLKFDSELAIEMRDVSAPKGRSEEHFTVDSTTM